MESKLEALTETGESEQKVETCSYKRNKPWDVTYSVVNLVNNTQLYVRELHREEILTFLNTRKKISTTCGDGY